MLSRLFNRRRVTPIVMFLTLLPASLLAAPVQGQLSIAGDAQVAATFLNFLCTLAVAQPCPGGYGNFIATGTQSGDFVPLANEEGFISGISQAGQPVNQPFLLTDFVFFNSPPVGSDIRLDLTFIYTGVFGQAQCGLPEAAGQVCTPIIPALVTAANPSGLSPFNLSNTQTGSVASFSVAGTARRAGDGDSQFIGTFSATFTGQSYQDLLTQLGPGGPGTIQAPYDAQFDVTVIPEPGTSALLLCGFLGIAASLYRRRPRG